MKILFVTAQLATGGLEVLSLRFAEAFSVAGNEVSLYDFDPAYRDKQLINQFDTNIFKLVTANIPPWKSWVLWKVNAVLNRTKILPDLHYRFLMWSFSRFVQKNNFDVICSLDFKVDYFTCKYKNLHNTPIVITMHGTYELYAHQYPERAKYIYENADAIIYAAEKNMSWYRSQIYYNRSVPEFKILTGTNIDRPVPVSDTRVDLKISPDAIVFIMVARGIKEKGWDQAIRAYVGLQKKYPETVLLLVGEGDYLNDLKNKYSSWQGIIFYGSHPNSTELTGLANVGLLPSYFAGETMPNVIIDYLYCKLPVISTAVGSIPDMLLTPDGDIAGNILSVYNEGVAIEDLQSAMELYVEDEYYLRSKSALAAQAAIKFDINKCIISYLEVFQQAITGFKKSD